MAIFSAIGGSLATAILGAGAAGTLGFTFIAGITAGALQIAAGIGLSLIAKALAGDSNTGPKFSVQGSIQGGDDVLRSILFGRSCTAGSIVYANTWGQSGSTPDAFLTQVIALADYPITSLEKIFVDGNEATLLKGSAHPTYGWPVEEFRRGGGLIGGGNKDHLWVKFYDGNQTTADSFLVGTVSSSERPYTSDRIGRGIPYVIVTSLAHERTDNEEEPLFRGIPKLKFETIGSKLYNIALDSTAGGSGSHRRNDPTTWGGAGDHNPVVQIYNILMGINYNNNWLYGAQSMPPSRLPSSNWISAINKAAQSVITVPGQSEPLYRSGGEIQVGAQVKTALETLLTTCQGRLTETGGTYKIHIGEPSSPVASFTDQEIISTDEQSFVPFLGLEDTVNGIQATYPNPEEAWNTKTAPPLYRPDLEAEVGNRRLMANISLDFVPYIGQVQRLILSALKEAQRERRHTIVLGSEYWRLEPGDYISWTSVRNGYINKLFRIDGIVDRLNLDIMIDITEVDPDDYNWQPDTDFVPVINGPVGIVGITPLIMYGWQVMPAIIYDDQGRQRRPSIEVWYEPNLPSVSHVKIQVKLPTAADNDLTFQGEVPYGDPFRVILAGQFPPDTEFLVRGIYIRNSNRPSTWSEWTSVTTFDIKLLAGEDFDPYEGVVGFDSLDDDLREWTEWIGRSPRELLEAIQNVDTHVADQEGSNELTFTQVRQEIALTDEENRASWSNEINLIVSQNLALAQEVTQLTAVVGENTADIIQEAIARADGDTALAGQITTLQATVENDITAAINNEAIARADADGAIAATLMETVAGQGEDLSSARFKMESVSGPSGYTRIGASARATFNGTWKSASWYLDVPNTGSAPSRFVVEADQFIVTNAAGSANSNPLIYDGTALRLNVANIGTINAGLIQSGTGASFWNLNTGAFRISTS